MASDPKLLRCAIYTRKSTEHGLELEFNSLDAQRDACEAYIKSQASQGWKALLQHYDDPAYSGGNLDRPALKKLLADIETGKIDVVVVYKIDRLTRSLADFAKLVEAFDARLISFVAVTQQFNTTTSMGRLTLNLLLSFAQFERELSSERVRERQMVRGRASSHRRSRDFRTGPAAPRDQVQWPEGEAIGRRRAADGQALRRSRQPHEPKFFQQKRRALSLLR
jgi:DNA invertase Pin-like site-specific DNA recombinase